MLENAQEKGHSLENLERGEGTRAAQKNRYEAQKQIRKEQGPPPQGYDYDEFPYASTKQGGAGAHVEPVLNNENQAVGRDLGQFYRINGIAKNGKFDVKIID
ncbi:NucA/NucB deoxyribonuclease domain-containing protein [Paenibacillus auburnensis]|uniref:NucA/NucB deoxyribonuclease domain-containing protein n=1 Tax=Paenibacillus auburnensis TaxID=2905649 RepID=UPI001F47C5B0|nr:NucA/NucB deoxyribonuclease domain-containing protein [Paenibacillus auburnensis]